MLSILRYAIQYKYEIVQQKYRQNQYNMLFSIYKYSFGVLQK